MLRKGLGLELYQLQYAACLNGSYIHWKCVSSIHGCQRFHLETAVYTRFTIDMVVVVVPKGRSVGIRSCCWLSIFATWWVTRQVAVCLLEFGLHQFAFGWCLTQSCQAALGV